MFLYIVLFLIGLLIFYSKWVNTYWSRRNVKGPSPSLIFGNYFDYFRMKRHFGLINDDIYKAHPKAAYVGMYRFQNPVVLIRDLDLVKAVLVKNFNNFKDNDFAVDDKRDPLLTKSPFFSLGNKWKINRNQTSPIFTAAKVKSIFPLVQTTGDKFIKHIDSNLSANIKEFDVKMLCYKFAIENVASCLFSLEAGAFTDTNSTFAIYARKIFDTSFLQTLRFAIAVFVPSVTKIYRSPFLPKETNQWFRSVIKQLLHERNSNIRRNDFLQCLLDASKKAKEPYTEEDVGGHCFTFLVEGFETSSVTMTYTLLELAVHPDMQASVRKEIDDVLNENNGEFTEESFQKLVYLEKCIFESMRKNTAVFAMSKICTKPFILPPQYPGEKSGPTVEVGTSVIIPMHSIHSDPSIYPNPHIYDPSRFDESGINSRHKYAFIPFGEGPRLCIGMKFAMLQVKMALASLLANFNVKLSPQTKPPLDISPKSFFLTCDEGVWLTIEKRIK